MKKDRQDEKFFEQVDDFLRQRRAAPQMPSDMVASILAKAGPRPVSRRWGWLEILSGVRDVLILPQPAVAFALLLVGGAFIGVEMEALWSVWGTDWTGFLEIEEIGV